MHFTADGGFIVGGFTDRAGTNFPGFKSGGQIDEGRPVLHKFSAALANASSASNNPTPEWSYNCGPTNSVCKMEDGSIKNMRVYMDGGKDLRFFCLTLNSVFLTQEWKRAWAFPVKTVFF